MKIGIIGWATRTGLGVLHRQLYYGGLAQKWLIPQHPLLGCECDDPHPDIIRCTPDILPTDPAFASFMRGLDCVIITERSFLKQIDIWAECRARGIMSCVIPMLEFFPDPLHAPWVRSPDVLWAVNRHTAHKVDEYRNAAACRWANRILVTQWGADTAANNPRPLTTCERFLFINGWGGTHNRKGLEVVLQTAALVPEIPIVVLSQTTKGLPATPPNNVELYPQNFPTTAELYTKGDMLLAPSRWEGLGLQLWEAYAAGLPVITSNAAPMNELPGVITVGGRYSNQQIDKINSIAAYDVYPKSLAKVMQAWYKQPITAYGRFVREMANQHNVLAQLDYAKIQLEHFLNEFRRPW